MSLMKGKKGLIMGVANERSIAWGISQKLAEAGAELAFTYLGDALKKRVIPLAEKLNSKITFSCDVEKKDEVIKLFENVKSKLGEIDFVVHAVAFSDKSELSGEYLNTSRENFLKSMLISCFSFTEVSKEASKIMKDGGSLLTLTYESNKAIPNYNVMGVCKSALEASVKYLARDLGAKGIRVNAIAPGEIKTDIITPESEEIIVPKIPLGRFGTPEEVAQTIYFLCSDMSHYLNGSEIHINGGQHVR